MGVPMLGPQHGDFPGKHTAKENPMLEPPSMEFPSKPPTPRSSLNDTDIDVNTDIDIDTNIDINIDMISV